MDAERPLIMVSNDDGIASPGLQALVAALYPLGDIAVVAPRSPFSSAGRSFIWGSREIDRYPWPLEGVVAYAVDAAPALTVRIGLSVLLPRQPTLMVSGINYGENLGTDVTLSGTVGAAIEAAVAGVFSLAISLEAPPEYHDNPRPGPNFGVAAAFAYRLARRVLAGGVPEGVDLLNVNVPAAASPDTPWRLTRVSRQPYWCTIVKEGPDGTRQLAGYERRRDLDGLEPDSDIYTFLCAGAISISPLTVDLSVPQAVDYMRPVLEKL